MKGVVTWLLFVATVVLLGVTAVSVYFVRGALPAVGGIILVSVSLAFILVPCFLLVFLVRFILKAENFNPGPFGMYLRVYNKIIPLKPLSQEFPMIDTSTTTISEEGSTKMIAPSQESHNYLGYAKIYQILRNAGINLDQPDDEKEVNTGPILHVVGGTDPNLSDELSMALRFYDSGNRSRNDLAACMNCTPHKASHLITQLKAKGLVN